MAVWNAQQQLQQRFGIHMNKLFPLRCLPFTQNVAQYRRLQNIKEIIFIV